MSTVEYLFYIQYIPIIIQIWLCFHMTVYRWNLTMYFEGYWGNHAIATPDNKVHGANMGPTWVLSAPDEPHVGPMNLVIRDSTSEATLIDELIAIINWLLLM